MTVAPLPIAIHSVYKSLRVKMKGPVTSESSHRFKNFGENVYRTLREKCEISIAEIDIAQDEFYLRKIHKREARTFAKEVRKLAEKDRMADLIDIDELESNLET